VAVATWAMAAEEGASSLTSRRGGLLDEHETIITCKTSIVDNALAVITASQQKLSKAQWPFKRSPS
jgi:hypothetical protein